MLRDKPNWRGLIPNIVMLLFLCIVALPAVLGPEWTSQAFAGVFREDGTLRVPGTARFSKHEDQALLAAAAAVETIWEWGGSRAAAYDDGSYWPVPNDEIEQERRANNR